MWLLDGEPIMLTLAEWVELKAIANRPTATDIGRSDIGLTGDEIDTLLAEEED